MIMAAYGLTEQELVVTGLVCQGLSTGQIAARLVSGYTVQDHLKSVFDKTGVRSRRELVATILRQHYLPPGQPRPPGRARRVLHLIWSTTRPAATHHLPVPGKRRPRRLAAFTGAGRRAGIGRRHPTTGA